MKKISFFLMAFGLVAASCTKSEFDYVYDNSPQAQFNQQFIDTYGAIAPGHDWGFSSASMKGASMRGASTWNGDHTCLEENWEAKLENIKLPDGAFQLDQEGNSYYNDYLWPEPGTVYKIPSNATVMYLSEDFNGLFAFEGNIPAGAVLYNYGTVTGFSGNFSGTITIYNLGTMTYNPGSQDHNVINTGTLYVKDNDACAKILKLYNGGHLEFDGSPAQLHSKSTYYSNGEGTIDMPYGGVIESACDIHGTINVTGNLNIQTGSTDKKICGIVATGRVQNTAGRLEVSYINADDIYFEGNNIYLTPGAHLKANTMEFDKAACDVHAAAGSNALVEVTKNIHFMNDNDFNRTFSDNIYFKIDGSIDMNGQTNGGFTEADRKLYDSADKYIEAHGNPNDKLNAGDAKGAPECGKPWTVGTPKNNKEVGATKRIIAEDLAAENGSDFDYNDVVFDAHIEAENGVYTAYIDVKAAGGTMPLYVGGKEVHTEVFGVSSYTTMINTNAAGGRDNLTAQQYTYVLTAADLEKAGDNVNDLVALLNYIPVVVHKGKEVIELTTTPGAAPEKIAVDPEYKWTKERMKLSDAYEKFEQYVRNSSLEWWTPVSNESLLYQDKD